MNAFREHKHRRTKQVPFDIKSLNQQAPTKRSLKGIFVFEHNFVKTERKKEIKSFSSTMKFDLNNNDGTMKGTNKMIHSINKNYVSIIHGLEPSFVFDESDLIFKVTHYPSFLHT